MRLVPALHFELLGVFLGARGVALHYRNQAGRMVVEVLEFADTGRVIRAAAHYA